MSRVAVLEDKKRRSAAEIPVKRSGSLVGCHAIVDGLSEGCQFRFAVYCMMSSCRHSAMCYSSQSKQLKATRD